MMPENPPALSPRGLARPGPHPHEADPEDLRIAAGENPELPEGVEPYDFDNPPEAPKDPYLAEPGPHPHEASDHKRLRGDQKGLPEGVEPFRGEPEPEPEGWPVPWGP